MEAAYDSDVLAHALRLLLDRDRRLVVGFTGESGRDQEHVLGYRFSRARGGEGIRLIESDGDIQTLLFDPQSLDNPERMSTHFRWAFSDRFETIPEEIAAHARVIGSSEAWNLSSYALHNPSYFVATPEAVTTYSPVGDFLDEMDGSEVAFGRLLDEFGCKVVRGAVYRKEQEVPRVTSNVVLTASNLDLATRRLTFEGARYLREGVVLAAAQRPRAGDVVVCTSSGSLKHLGKIAVLVSDVDAYIGGFLTILRCDDPVHRKVIEYNLLSRRFRQFVSGLKEQNITNLTSAKLRSFPARRPADLAAFKARYVALEEANAP